MRLKYTRKEKRVYSFAFKLVKKWSGPMLRNACLKKMETFNLTANYYFRFI